jgi:hypothetical protein
MKYRLQIQSGPYISLSCDAWAEHTDGNGSMQIKLFNPAMAQMITGRMQCQILSSGKLVMQGNIRKTENKNLFIFEK